MKIWRWHSSDRSHRSSIWCSDITVPLGICCKRNRLSFVPMSHTIRLRPRWLLTTNNSCQTEEFVMSDENNRHDWKSMVIPSSDAIAIHMVTRNVQQNVCSHYRGLLKSGRMNHGGLVIFVHSALVKLSWWTKAEHQTVKTASGRPIWIRIRPLFFQISPQTPFRCVCSTFRAKNHLLSLRASYYSPPVYIFPSKVPTSTQHKHAQVSMLEITAKLL